MKGLNKAGHKSRLNYRGRLMKTSTAGLLTAFKLSSDPSHTTAIGDVSNRTQLFKVNQLNIVSQWWTRASFVFLDFSRIGSRCARSKREHR